MNTTEQQNIAKEGRNRNRPDPRRRLRPTSKSNLKFDTEFSLEVKIPTLIQGWITAKLSKFRPHFIRLTRDKTSRFSNCALARLGSGVWISSASNFPPFQPNALSVSGTIRPSSLTFCNFGVQKCVQREREKGRHKLGKGPRGNHSLACAYVSIL